MSINFFAAACQNHTTATRFGLCDDENNTPAYIDTADQLKWIAIVENQKIVKVTFTAIDNCIAILRADGSMERRCDGMLTYTDNIVFVELKNQRNGWISDALDQLEITIKHFTTNHDIKFFQHKRAFACNKKHPNFQVIRNEIMKKFFDTYRIRINIQAKIKI
jgi:hypothetical protein